MIVSFWILIYLIIGLAIYFTLPNRQKMPVHITLPFIVAWFVLAFVFLFPPGKKKERG